MFVLYFQTKSNDRNSLNALWGKLAAEILMQNWEAALEDLNKLKEIIGSNVSSLMKSIQFEKQFEINKECYNMLKSEVK